MVVVEAGKSLCKGPVAGPGLACWRSSKEVLVAGAEWVRGTEGGESGEEVWQGLQGLLGPGEDLGSYPKGGGKPRELWAEEGWDLLRCSQAPSGGCCNDRLWGCGGSLMTRAGATPCSVRLCVPISAWTCSLSGSLHEVVCTSLSEDQAPRPALEGGWTGLVSPCLPH